MRLQELVRIFQDFTWNMHTGTSTTTSTRFRSLSLPPLFFPPTTPCPLLQFFSQSITLTIVLYMVHIFYATVLFTIHLPHYSLVHGPSILRYLSPSPPTTTPPWSPHLPLLQVFSAPRCCYPPPTTSLSPTLPLVLTNFLLEPPITMLLKLSILNQLFT